MSIISPELQNKLSIWRSKAAAGTITLEEMREAIVALRAGRKGAAAAPSTKSKSNRSADELLGDLGL